MFTERGKRCGTSAMDQVFIVSCVLKHGDYWKYNAKNFKKKTETFE